MYIIFNHHTCELQLGFQDLQKANADQGLYFTEIFPNSFKLKNENFTIISNNYLKLNENSGVSKDYRFLIKNKKSKAILHLLLDLFFLNQNQYHFIKKVIYTCFVLFVFIKIANISLFHMNNKVTLNQNASWTPHELLSHFKKSSYASYISKNKYDFLDGSLPEIKGIQDFQILPLKSENEETSSAEGFLAVPYSKILSVKNNESFVYKIPITKCLKANLYIYKIDEKDELIFLKNSEKTSKFKTYFIHLEKNPKNTSSDEFKKTACLTFLENEKEETL
jgi:hypothetical protein